jgi:hypothetical protein
MEPPRIARWLLTHFGCSPNNDAVIGDLDERYQQNRSGLWYWQQMLVALVTGFTTEVRRHKRLVFRAVAIGWVCSALYMLAVISAFNNVGALMGSRMISGPTGLA